MLNKIVSIIALLALLIVQTSYSLTIDDVFKMETQSSSFDAVQAQGRYFLVGGSLQLKAPQPVTVQPIKIVPPSIQAGCGGISITSGALSFMNFDQLVSLLQGVVAAAPGVAVRLILSTICPQCDTIMSSVMQLVNQINSMNFNSCQITQNLMGQAASLVGLKTGEEVSGGSNDWQQKIVNKLNDWKNSVKSFMDNLSESCGSDNSCKAGTQGKFIIKPTLLEIVKRTNSQVFNNDLISLFRAFFGDIYELPEGDNMTLKILDPYGDYSNKSIIQVLAFGNGNLNSNHQISLKIYGITTDNNSGYFSDKNESSTQFKPYAYQIEELLYSIYDKVFFGQGNFNINDLNQEQKQLINSMPVPILAFMMQAALAQKATGAPYMVYAAEYIREIKDALAVVVAYNKVLELQRLVRAGISKYRATLERKDSDNINKILDDYIRNFESELWSANTTIYRDAMNKISEVNRKMTEKYNEARTAVATALFNTGLLDNYRWR
jgi:conjugative transfer pilus assembly protein TraH